MMSKIRNGLTPYQTELFMWNRQMRDLRKIYRAQFFQKLSEVTEEQRHKQLEVYQQERAERKKRREEIQERQYEARKRKAILKDRLRIEKKVTQVVELARSSKRKMFQINHFDRIQKKSQLLEHDELSESTVLTRNVSVPDLLKQLGHSQPDEPQVKTKQCVPADNIFRSILEESFKHLPEDEMQYEERPEPREGHEQRAKMEYSSFTDAEKLELLDEKIKMLATKIDGEARLKGSSGDLLSIQLKDQLEAAKLAFLEKQVVSSQEEDTVPGREDD